MDNLPYKSDSEHLGGQLGQKRARLILSMPKVVGGGAFVRSCFPRFCSNYGSRRKCDSLFGSVSRIEFFLS
ncbi:hypothetical protein GQ457_12G006970 [Hibiscus cannabinus]